MVVVIVVVTVALAAAWHTPSGSPLIARPRKASSVYVCVCMSSLSVFLSSSFGEQGTERGTQNRYRVGASRIITVTRVPRPKFSVRKLRTA